MNFNRRHFLGLSAFASVGTWWYLSGNETRFFDESTQVMIAMSEHLYPTSALGFGVSSLHIASYFAFVLEDERIMKEDRDYLINGSRWVQEQAMEDFDKSFLHLTVEEKEKLLQSISELKWGYSYIRHLLGYLFEAMFSAPIYGSNIQEIGWKWSGHNPGFPQPQTRKEISYV